MELTQSHRKALLFLLEKTMIDNSITKMCMEKDFEPKHTLIELFEIDDFLQKQTIDTIKNALIQNQIDY